MANVLLAAYLLIVLALIGVILIQRSEGGGLGMGGGGGGGGLVSARGSANLLTRTTAILAALFMASAIGLTLLNQIDPRSDSILDAATSAGAEGGEGAISVLDALNNLQGDTASELPVPEGAATAGDDAPNLPVPVAPAEGADAPTGSN